MKVFFDTNVFVAEALLGDMAEQLVGATLAAGWYIYTSDYLLDEAGRVLTEDLGFSRRLASVVERRIARRARCVRVRSSAQVPHDPKDSPILQAALSCAADYLVTNDRHLLTLDPVHSLRIISMSAYCELLKEQGLL